MASYIFVVNLVMDGAAPSYQIGIQDKNKDKYFWIPQGKMPFRFKQYDEISFYFFERSIVDCILYIRPLDKDGESPFEACYCSDVPISDDKWQIPIYKNRKKLLESICIKQSEGVWDFTIAGTMDSELSSSIVDGKVTPLVNDAKIVRPFIIDPEVVVGNRH